MVSVSDKQTCGVLGNLNNFDHQCHCHGSMISNTDKEDVTKTESMLVVVVVVCKTQQKKNQCHKLTKELN